MNPLAHQIHKAEELYENLITNKVSYLMGEIRSGKTLTAILAINNLPVNKCLVLTRKAAISGWEKFRENMEKEFVITNYEQVSKLNSNEFDLVVIDEAHNLGVVGKPTQRVKDIRKFAYDKYVILMSGTPFAETKAALYHQFCVSKNSPFRDCKTFYDFFRLYGIPETKFIAGRTINVYKKTKPNIVAVYQPYTVVMSQDDAGITLKGEDKVHYVQLNTDTKAMYNELLKKGIVVINGEEIVCENDMALRLTLHQLETGIEKFDYIKLNFKGKIAIMSHFIKERGSLQKYIDDNEMDATIYSSNAHACGVDLSSYDHFIILSSDYSGAMFIQRKERNVNINNTKQPVTHHILVKDAISEQVYKTVSNKKDFNNSVFQKKQI